MLGSAVDPEDAVQVTLVRAGQSSDRVEGRSSVRSWRDRNAADGGLEALRAGRRRAPGAQPDRRAGPLQPQGPPPGRAAGLADRHRGARGPRDP
ncbi:MAG: hypothetical protein KY463_16220 [Actinobacteria bacterium]|nr:hypothetical protein [Actinomycetota bacterium]